MTFKEIEAIRSGKNVNRYNSDLFTFFYIYNTNKIRCTIVVKKKMIKLAVKRNKIRRRIRAVMEKYVEYPLCIMMICKRDFDYMTFDRIKTDINMFFTYVNRKTNNMNSCK